MGKHQKIWLIVFAAVLLGFGPLLVPFFRGQFAPNRAEYHSFPLLLAAIAFFLWSRWEWAKPIQREHWFWQLLSWLATLAAFVNLGLAMFFYSPWLAMVAFIFFAFSFALNVWQRWEVKGIFMIWLLTWLLLPPPLDRDKMFVTQLQLFSSELSSRILDGFGIMHVLRGNIFEMITDPPKNLFVDQACSGIVSLVSIITCIAIYVVWQQRGLFHFLLLILFGVAWTVFMNSIRLSSIGTAWAWYQVDLSEGVPHALLGLVIFGISAGVVFCFDKLLGELLTPIDYQWRLRDGSSAMTGVGLMKVWNRFFANPVPEELDDDEWKTIMYSPEHETHRQKFLSPVSACGWPVLILLALAGIAQIALVAPSEAKLQSAIKASMQRAIDLDESFEPVAGVDLKFVRFETDERNKFDAWGEYSRTYLYEDQDGKMYSVSIDFPFGPHWHDLRDCYKGSGWTITQEKWFVMDLELDPAAAPRLGTGTIAGGWEADEFLNVRRNEASTSFVVHSAFYADGKIFNRPRGGSLFYDFVTHVAKGRDRQEQADYFQVQVVTNNDVTVTPAQQEIARKLIGIVSERFREHVAEK